MGGEVFRAATNLYFDYHNNALVNNTSGAINFLVKTGVLTVPMDYLAEYPDNITVTKDKIFNILYPYSIGSKIHFYEGIVCGGILCPGIVYNVIENMMDVTLEYLRQNPKMDDLSNTFDFQSMRDIDELDNEERCAIRNRWTSCLNDQAMRLAAEANAAEAQAAAEVEANKAKSMPMGNVKKLQNAPSSSLSGAGVGTSSSSGLGNYNRANDNSMGGGEGNNNKTKGRKGVVSKLSKLSLFD